MKIKTSKLDIVCGITSILPQNDKPEVAFAGKSNVGKSSLINGLLNRKALARTSSEPGKTRTINYYLINDEFYFVDLPGYGFAKVSQNEKEKWGQLIENYLHTSVNLRQVFLLIDMRHEPGKNDVIMYEWIISQGFRPVVIGTKLDKLKRSQVVKQKKLIRAALNMQKEDLFFAFSAKTKDGREEILDYIENLVGEEQAE